MITITHVETTYPPPADDEEDYCPDGESTSYDREYTFRELLTLIEKYPDPSSSHMRGETSEWFSRQDQDYRTGDYVTESIHFAHGQNPRNAKYWRAAIRNSK